MSFNNKLYKCNWSMNFTIQGKLIGIKSSATGHAEIFNWGGGGGQNGDKHCRVEKQQLFFQVVLYMWGGGGEKGEKFGGKIKLWGPHAPLALSLY